MGAKRGRGGGGPGGGGGGRRLTESSRSCELFFSDIQRCFLFCILIVMDKTSVATVNIIFESMWRNKYKFNN